MKKLFKNLFFIFHFLLALPVYAQEAPPKLVPEGGEAGLLSVIIERALGYLFPIAGLIAVIFVIQGGYMWIISAGDPARVKQAQGTLTWAVIGLLFILVIFAVLQAVLKFVY